MTMKVMINASIDLDDASRVQALAALSGKSKSEILRELIGEALAAREATRRRKDEHQANN